MSAIQAISNYVYGAESSFQSMLSDRSLNFEREAGFAIQILTANEYVSKLAANDRQSVVNAVTNIAAIGISLNPAKKQAYLVPRKGKICLDISYLGLIDLAIQSGSIMWAQAELVHSGDTFTLNGFDKPPTHSYNPFSSDRGDLVGAYVVAKTHVGDYLTTCMSRSDIDSIKNRSESVKAGKSSPWDTDYGEMAKKTVVKRGQKYWPKTERLDMAVHHLNTEGGEGLTQTASTPMVVAEAPPALLAAAEAAAQRGTEAYKAYWTALSAADRKLLAGHHIGYKAAAAKADAQAATTDVEVKNDSDRSAPAK